MIEKGHSFGLESESKANFYPCLNECQPSNNPALILSKYHQNQFQDFASKPIPTQLKHKVNSAPNNYQSNPKQCPFSNGLKMKENELRVFTLGLDLTIGSDLTNGKNPSLAQV